MVLALMCVLVLVLMLVLVLVLISWVFDVKFGGLCFVLALAFAFVFMLAFGLVLVQSLLFVAMMHMLRHLEPPRMMLDVQIIALWWLATQAAHRAAAQSKRSHRNQH